MSTEANAIKRIREHSAALGHPPDALTDEEIRAGSAQFARALQSYGFNATDALKGIQALQSGLRVADLKPPKAP